MDLRPRLLDLLERAYGEEQVLVQGLSGEERAAVGTPEQWSAKDVIAHIAAWKGRPAQVLASLRRREPGPGFDGPDQINARIFEEHQNLAGVMSSAGQRRGLDSCVSKQTPHQTMSSSPPKNRTGTTN